MSQKMIPTYRRASLLPVVAVKIILETSMVPCMLWFHRQWYGSTVREGAAGETGMGTRGPVHQMQHDCWIRTCDLRIHLHV